MQKTCVNGWCKAPFEVTDEDLAFYDKVSPEFGGKKYAIPPPTLCPDCRQQRRMGFRNQIHVYIRPSATTEKPIFSMFDKQSCVRPVADEEWWGDTWDPCSFGKPFDENTSFFKQFHALQCAVPHFARSVKNMQNSDYSNNGYYIKNCYFVFHSFEAEDSMYCEKANQSRDCLDCSYAIRCELCYDCTWCSGSYRLQSSVFCDNCSDSFFLKHCSSCRNCFGCVNLKHAQYCIFNEQKTREEYETFIASLSLSSYHERTTWKERAEEIFRQFPVPHVIALQTENVTGNCIQQSRDVHDCFFILQGEGLRRCFSVNRSKDCQDVTTYGENCELFYESTVCGENSQRLSFCYECFDSSINLLYCHLCIGCTDCFGCVGLRKKKYCVLNVQYTKEEYEKLVPVIIARMRKDAEWGEFFPRECSPTAYNHSVAQRYHPLKKETAEAMGYRWIEESIPEASNAIEASELPDGLPASENPIIVKSATSNKPFKITTEEIKRYKNFNVPLPRETYDERMEARAAHMGGITLFDRPCAKTGKQIRTTIPATSPFIVWDREEWEKEFGS